MPISRLLRRLAGAVLPVTIVALLPAPALAVGQWVAQTHELVGGKDEVLLAARVFSGQDAWAAGYVWGVVGGALEFRTYVQHWNGAGWTRSPTRDVESAPATNLLFGIDGRSGSNVWAVGYYRDATGINRALIEHWDGTAWTIVPSPNQGAFHNELEAVAVTTAGDAWAVGNYSAAGIDYGPLGLHWDGSAWSTVAMPIPGFCTHQIDLTSVAARGPANILAVGHCASDTGRQGFVLRSNGRRWRVVAGPELVPASSELHGITFAGPAEAWAVGMANNTALTLHMVNNVWSVVPSAAAGLNSSLTGINAHSPTDVWAVGVGPSSQPPFAGRLSLHWDGIAWTRFDAGNFGSFNAVDGFGRQTWAVGQNVSDSLIMWRRD